MAQHLAHQQSDVVHQHGIWQAFSATVLGLQRRLDIPVIVSTHGMLDPWALRHSSFKKRTAAFLYERRNLERAACIHALSHSEAASIRAFGLDNPIALIPNGIDLPNNEELAPPIWWPGKQVVLFLGRIHPKKGVFELIEAWAKFKRNEPECAKRWHLVIAGWDDGGHLDRLEQQIEAAGLEDRVVLPGSLFDAQKHAALRHASAFILPSFSEGLPMTVLEAWSYGLPVMMTKYCNLPEGFAANAAIEISTEPNMLAADLGSFLANDENALSAMGDAGRKLVYERFQWSSIARQMQEVYRWMLDGGSQPSCIVTD